MGSSSYPIIARLIAFIVLLFSVFLLPWHITSLYGIFLIALLPSYYEALVAGLFIDLLYGVSLPKFFGFTFVFTLGALILLIISVFIRKQLRVR